MTVKQVLTGEVLYIYPEETAILVVMTGSDGFRYIEPMNPEFDDHGNLITKYVTYGELSNWTISFGSITNISATLMGK
jgi:hypothetical protein